MNRLSHPTIDMSPEGIDKRLRAVGRLYEINQMIFREIDEVCGREPHPKWIQDALDRMPKD